METRIIQSLVGGRGCEEWSKFKTYSLEGGISARYFNFPLLVQAEQCLAGGKSFLRLEENLWVVSLTLHI